MENTFTSEIERYGAYNIYEKKYNIDGCIKMLKNAIEKIEELKKDGELIRIEKLELIISNPMLCDDLDSIGYKFMAEVKKRERE